MRYLPALLLTFSTLCAAWTPSATSNPQQHAAEADTPVSLPFKGDRIVIFRDNSAAFVELFDNVLRDPEVAEFMQRNFAVYVIETGSPQADALPFLGGARLEPRTVIVAPRLDNFTAFLHPKITKPNLLALLKAVNQAQVIGDVNAAMGVSPSPSAENMTGWAREFYPAITAPGSAPQGLLVGLLISRDMKVVNHSVAIATPSAASLEELRRMFPRTDLTQVMDHGASCFGGINPNEAKYCVVWALVTK